MLAVLLFFYKKIELNILFSRSSRKSTSNLMSVNFSICVLLDKVFPYFFMIVTP